jgi:uncharacterized protein (DUF2235 family)
MKRLIVCCDGTWQKLDNPYPTNVVKMAQAVRSVDKDGIHQIVYYGEGIGTEPSDSKFLGSELLEGAFGWGINEKIKDAYRFLCLNYSPDDEIYLFGFSRGAYTVRCLAGLIYNSGLLQREFIRKIPEAYALYRDRNKNTHPTKGKKALLFRQQHGEHVDIKVLACWDTVGALGIPDLIPYFPLDNMLNEKYNFFDTELNPKIEKAFHATAVDEPRKTFNVTGMQPNAKCSPDQVKQVWFPGGHGCVGGGTEDTRGLSDAALLWMMKQVENLGLALDTTKIEGGIAPKYDTPFDCKPDLLSALGGEISRTIQCDFSGLHDSVKKRWRADLKYRPKNLYKFNEDFKMWESEEAQSTKKEYEAAIASGGRTGT